jgi:adenylate cyclase
MPSPPVPGVRRLPRILVALLPLAWVLVHVSAGGTWQGLERLDALLQDTRTRLILPRTLDTRIVIVDIDDRSLAEVGRWPWPRDRLAHLLDELFDRQDVALVGFGRVFDAPDDSTGLARLRQLADTELRGVPAFGQTLRALAPRLDHDGQLAGALRDRPVVLGYHFTREAPDHTAGALPAPVLAAERLRGHAVRVTEWTGYTANIGRLAQAAAAAGFLEPHTDPDGLVRAVPLLATYEGQYHEALALAMYRVLLGSPPIQPGFPQARFPAHFHGLERLVLPQGAGSVSIPVSEGITARLPFRGPGGAAGGSFRYVPAADLLAGRLPAGSLQGQLVLVGATAAGLDTRYATPVGARYPAIEVHATLLSGLLDGRLPVRPDYASGYGRLVLIGAGLLLALALPALSTGPATLLFVAVVAGIIILNVWLAVMAGLTLPLAPALLMATASFALSMGYGSAVAYRRRRELSRLLGTEVPPARVQRMLEDDPDLDVQAVRRDLTVMFCDVRGFTRWSEAMEPAALQALLQAVLGELSEIIGRHGGTVDKYVGDCVMAFWGAPVDMPDHARRAMAAALDLSQAVRTVNARHAQQGLPMIELGIGLNTGAMCVGDLGPPRRRVYTVVGEAVNLAAWLERLSATYGVTVVAGEATQRAVPELAWLELDRVRLAGRAHAVSVYAPRLAPPHEDPDAAVAGELRTWSAFLKAYRAQDTPSCERLLASLADAPVLPPPLRALYARRVAALRGQPLDTRWDGVTAVGAV